MAESGQQSRSCVDLETLAAFVDDKLASEERQAVLAHLAVCDDCADLVAELVSADEAFARGTRDTPARVIPFSRKSWTVGVALAAAAAALVAAVLIPALRRQGPGVDPALTRLVAAIGDERVVEGRLTGGFPYGRLRTPTRGASETRNLALLAAAGELQKAADAQPTAAHLHNWGVAQLTLGNYDEGVQSLEAALLEEKTARVAADLGVALLARATATGRQDDLPRALENLEQALQLQPNLAEAWFTKAIVLERLAMRDQAIQAWKRYLELAPESGWGEEARRRLAALQARTSKNAWPDLEKQLTAGALSGDVLNRAVRDYPFDVRDLMVRSLLPSWANEASPGARAEAFARASRVADALEEGGVDHFFQNTLSAIAGSSPEDQRTVAEGILELSQGLESLAAERTADEAGRHLDAAADRFERAKSDLALWADFNRTRVETLRGRHDAVVVLAESVVRRATALGAPSLAARAHLTLGLTAFTTSRWSDAIVHYDRALAFSEQSKEESLAVSIHINASILNRFLGNRAECWKHRLAAAEHLQMHRPLQVHSYLIGSAVTASLESLPLVSILFQNEAVSNAQASSLGAGPQLESYVTRARMLSRVGRSADAERDIVRAEQILNTLSQTEMRARFTRAWCLASSEVRMASAPARAASDARQAITLIVAEREPMRLAEARLFESRALTKAGDIDGARTAAASGIREFERALATISPTDFTRISAVEPVWSLYSEASSLYLDERRQDYAEAFAFAERGRAKTLHDLGRLPVLSLAEAQARLDPSEAILLLSQSSSTMLEWWVTHDAVRINHTAIASEQIERLVARHRRSIDRGTVGDDASKALFDLAFDAFRDELGKLSAVAVIPDGEWNRIAWPALWDKAAGQPLVNRVAIVVAPSASMALRGRTRDAWRAETALVVSAPDVSGNPELPSARLEAQDIAGIYASRRVLDGAAATPRAVLEGSAGADVVHVSSHAVDVPAYPQLSHLLLGSEAGSSKLFVGDIANRDLSRTRLVVLAACSTAGTTAVRGEGTIGVAWGFLTAGVHHVIATLQDVEDEPARQLFTRFHKRVAAGESPARALQVTERELAAAGASPRLWAVVAAIGTL